MGFFVRKLGGVPEEKEIVSGRDHIGNLVWGCAAKEEEKENARMEAFLTW